MSLKDCVRWVDAPHSDRAPEFWGGTKEVEQRQANHPLQAEEAAEKSPEEVTGGEEGPQSNCPHLNVPRGCHLLCKGEDPPDFPTKWLTP